MFNMLDPLAVISSLFHLMLLETPLQRYLRVRGSMRVEDTNIKKTLFRSSTPESIGSDVKSGSVSGVSRPACEHFSCQSLKDWLDTNVIADFS